MIVQKLRLQKGWSQSQLAELSGLNIRTIQRIERGQPASVESLKALASVFEVDFNELKPKEGVMQSKPDFDNQSNSMSKEELLAYARLNRLKIFYSHLIKYIIVITALGILNYLKTPNKAWAIWVALIWGVSILWHAYQTFVWGFSPKWEKRFIEKQLKKIG